MKTFSKTKLSFRDLFSDSFIKKNTEFENLGEFLTATGFALQTQEQLSSITTEQWDNFVQKHTVFSSFEQMKTRAVDDYITRNQQVMS